LLLMAGTYRVTESASGIVVSGSPALLSFGAVG
jgi:hypothetical protein